MASGEPARNGKPESGARDRERDRERERERERDRDREREREREWVPRESAQQQQQQQHRERDREPVVAVHPRDMPAAAGPNAGMNAHAPPLAESSSGSFLSRIGGPYRSSPTASNSFRSDVVVGEQRSWPEDDWDGAARKRTLSGACLQILENFFWVLFLFVAVD